MEYKQNTNSIYQDLSNSIRILSADSVEAANSGHPGMPLGFADVFSVLISKFFKYCPKDPTWHARDRLVLSAGHGSMLLYSFYYLTGYELYSLEQLKNFRQLNHITAGHPEYEPGRPVETTTGPLGQGFANSVGMSVAQKKYQQKLGEIANYKIYCIVGDGCLMEGITSEAASLAGHLRLNNLVVLFDDNNISIDGATSLTTSDDHQAKFKALGWEVFTANGHDYKEIEEVLEKAQNSELPCFIAFKTKIGFGAGDKEESEKSHGAALGKEAIKSLRKNLGWKYNEAFYIPDEILAKCRNLWKYNEEYYNSWQNLYQETENHKKSYFEKPNYNEIESNIAAYTQLVRGEEATRVSFGRMVELILKFSDKVIVGSADLSISNGLDNNYCKAINADDFSGNFLHYGVRENAMAAIMNGLATQNFLPVGGTFLVFSDYMRPSIRLSALMNLHVIYVFTHDSIGVGEDGPTHQPAEHIASLRAMPNLRVYRPCDMMEAQSCLIQALSGRSGPYAFMLTRQKINQQAFSENRVSLTKKGAYILAGEEEADIAIWATGSEVEIAMHVREMLLDVGIKACVISAPCIELFLEQEESYKKKLLSYGKYRAAIEAAAKFGWERIIGMNGLFFGVEHFGISGKADEVYDYFELTAPKITNKIIKYLYDQNRN